MNNSQYRRLIVVAAGIERCHAHRCRPVVRLPDYAGETFKEKFDLRMHRHRSAGARVIYDRNG